MANGGCRLFLDYFEAPNDRDYSLIKPVTVGETPVTVAGEARYKVYGHAPARFDTPLEVFDGKADGSDMTVNISGICEHSRGAVTKNCHEIFCGSGDHTNCPHFVDARKRWKI